MQKYNCIQLELIPERPEERNAREIKEMREQQNKVRRSIYAKHGQLEKDLSSLKSEFESLVRLICQYQRIQPEQGELL